MEIDLNKLRKLYYQDPRLKYKQIAELLGVSHSLIASKIKRLQKSGYLSYRLDNGRQMTLTVAQTARLKRIKEYRMQGFTWIEISKQLNSNRFSVYKFVQYHCPEFLEQDVLNEKLIKKHQKLIELYQYIPRLTLKQIANQIGERLDVTAKRVQTLQKRGIIKYRAKPVRILTFTKQQDEKLRIINQLLKDGLNWRQIGDQLNEDHRKAYSFYYRQIQKLRSLRRLTPSVDYPKIRVMIEHEGE